MLILLETGYNTLPLCHSSTRPFGHAANLHTLYWVYYGRQMLPPHARRHTPYKHGERIHGQFAYHIARFFAFSIRIDLPRLRINH